MGAVSFGVADIEAAGFLADPLHEPFVFGAGDEGGDAVERIGRAAAGGFFGRFRPLVNH